jgi:biotin carboxyl carrier protein
MTAGGKRYRVRVGDREHLVEVTLDSEGRERITVDGIEYEVARAGAHAHRVRPSTPGERQIQVTLANNPSDTGRPTEAWIPRSGTRARVEILTEQEARLVAALGKTSTGAGSGSLKAPMPGRVVKVLIREGETIEFGAPAIIVEAMKMENELTAPITGVVARVDVFEGDTVDAGQILAEITPAA